MRRMICLALALPALAAAGCGDDEDDGAGVGPSGTNPATQTQRAEKTTPTATTPAAGRSAVTVVGTEFKFAPADIDVKAGTATFRLRNDGGAPHALEIEGNGVEEASDVVQAGQTTELKVALKPGRYKMYCPVGNHKEQGMVGTVTVS